MSSHHPHGSLENPDTDHETRDINLRAITGFLIVLIAIVLAADVAMWGLFKLFAHMEAQNDPVVSPLAPPAGQPLGPPGLQTTPWTDLTHFRAEQNAYLHGYGWIDERAGVARVPIDKAKEMLLKKGLPVGPELAGPLEGTHVAAGGESNGGRTLPGGAADTSTPAAAAPAATAPVPTTPPASVIKPGGVQ
jgi:hypothetical protein